MASFYFATFVVIFLALPTANSRERECGALFLPIADVKSGSSKLTIEITDEPIGLLIEGTRPSTWPPIVKVRNSVGEFALHELQLRSLSDPVLQAIDPSSEIQIFATIAGVRRELELPQGFKTSLAEYIRAGGPPVEPFDCNCFVQLMNGLPHEYTHFRTRLWNLDAVHDEAALRVTDTIVLGYSYREVKHVAIFLGHGLYISKMGDGPVLVTDFPTLQLGYGGFMLARGRPVLKVKK